jgi:hypothetical protein
VLTPARYNAGKRYRVGNATVRANGDGRLSFTIDAGDTAETYTAGPDAPGPRPTGPAVEVRIRSL